MYRKAILVVVLALAFKYLKDFFQKSDSNLDLFQDKQSTVYDLDYIQTEGKLYLAILGNIYDVEKGAKVYN